MTKTQKLRKELPHILIGILTGIVLTVFNVLPLDNALHTIANAFGSIVPTPPDVNLLIVACLALTITAITLYKLFQLSLRLD